MNGLIGDRLLHPWRSRRVDEVTRAAEPEAVGRAVQARDLPRADRVVRRAARGIGRDVRAHGRAGDTLRRLETSEIHLDEQVHLTGVRPGRTPSSVLVRGRGGRPLTATEAASECERLARAIDSAPTLDHHRTSSRAARVVGTALLGVDVVALVLVFARVFNVDWTAPASTALVGAVVFSVVGAGVMTRLAALLGEHVWVWRRSGPRGVAEAPARSGSALGLGVGLAVLSLATGAGIFLRILVESAALEVGALGPVLGVLVGAAGAIAPWLLVFARAHDGTELTRALADVAPIVAWTARRHRRLQLSRERTRARRRRCLERARLRLRRAELAVARRHRRYDEVVLLAAAYRSASIETPHTGTRLLPSAPPDQLAPLRDLLELMQPGLH